MVALEYHYNDGSFRHEIGETTEEGPLAMNGVKAFGLGLAQVEHLESRDSKAFGLQPRQDFSDDFLAYAIGLDD
jgi:hypothetical protein